MITLVRPSVYRTETKISHCHLAQLKLNFAVFVIGSEPLITLISSRVWQLYPVKQPVLHPAGSLSPPSEHSIMCKNKLFSPQAETEAILDASIGRVHHRVLGREVLLLLLLLSAL